MADQLRREDLAGMSPQEITAALKAGELADLLAGRPPEHIVELEAARAAALEAREAAKIDPPPSADQGARSTSYPQTEAGQRARVASMTPAEVRAAWRRGEFDAWIAGELP